MDVGAKRCVSIRPRLYKEEGRLLGLKPFSSLGLATSTCFLRRNGNIITRDVVVSYVMIIKSEFFFFQMLVKGLIIMGVLVTVSCTKGKKGNVYNFGLSI